VGRGTVRQQFLASRLRNTGRWRGHRH